MRKKNNISFNGALNHHSSSFRLKNMENTEEVRDDNLLIFHGSEITEILSTKPPFLIKWGTLIFICFLLFFALVCWHIQFPEVVIASAKLNSMNAPKTVTAKTEGKIEQILVKENMSVKDGESLAYIESLASSASVKAFEMQLDSMINLVLQNKFEKLISFYPDNRNDISISKLGELQFSYQTFVQSFILFKDILNSGIYFKKKQMLNTDLKSIRDLNTILNNQKKLIKEDISLTEETFNANEKLAINKVISSFDYRIEKSKLIAKQLSLPQINAAIISNEREQNEKLKEIEELENQVLAQKNTFIQALYTMKSHVQSWNHKYLIKAPVSGTVTFVGFVQEQQEIILGQELFFIQPKNISYYLELVIPQQNLGKVRKGQDVIIKFEAYPFEQYGSVIGKIDYVKSAPTDSGYLAKVLLPNGLITNHGVSIEYHYGLLAKAEIITKDMRLLEHFYYNLIKQLNN
jgi:multidrug resistance efflux pump